VEYGPIDHLNFWSCQAIDAAPFDLPLEPAVIDKEGPHALVFPCRRIDGGWADAKGRRVFVRPTHWCGNGGT
jgi:hypothetical protein